MGDSEKKDVLAALDRMIDLKDRAASRSGSTAYGFLIGAGAALWTVFGTADGTTRRLLVPSNSLAALAALLIGHGLVRLWDYVQQTDAPERLPADLRFKHVSMLIPPVTALAEFLVLLTLVVLAGVNCLLLSWVELAVIWLLVLAQSSILGAMIFLLERQGIPAKLGANELTTTRSALAVLVGCLAPVVLGTWLLLAPPAPLEIWNLRLGVLFAVAIMLLRFWMESASAPREVALLIDLRQGLAFDRVSTPVAMELGSVIHYGLELGNLVASHLRAYLYWMNEEARLSREFREFIEWLSSLPPSPPPDGPSAADIERLVAAGRTNGRLERASVLRFQAEQQFTDRLHRIQRFYPEAQPDQRILEPLNRAKAELEREQKDLSKAFEAATREAVKTGAISEEDAARLTQGDAPTPPAPRI